MTASYVEQGRVMPGEADSVGLPSLTLRLVSSHAAQIGLVVGLSAIIRLILFLNFPALLTADSWDYLAAGEGIYHRADFNSSALRDIRMPIYPVFLAVTYPLTDMQSDRIVLAQVFVGLLNVGLGMLMGYALGSSFIAVVLGLFLGLNPVYLLNEHAVMTEMLSLFTYLLFILAALACLRGEFTWYKGAVLGLAIALCLLTRPNALPFCAVVTAGVIYYRLREAGVLKRAGSRRKWVTFLVSAGMAGGVLIGPWLWRNYRLYHTFSLTNYINRNLLIFKVLHYPPDLTLPKMKAINQVLGTSEVNFDWLLKLQTVYSLAEAERITGELFWEQVAANPRLYIWQIASSFIDFGGFSGLTGNDLTASLYWFVHVVNQPQAWQPINTSSSAKSRVPFFYYVPVAGDASLGLVWSKIGEVYLRGVRPALYVLFFVLGIAYVAKQRLGVLITREVPGQMIGILGGGYLVTIVAHTLTLTDSDRYTSLFDWVPLLVILLIAGVYLQRRIKRTVLN